MSEKEELCKLLHKKLKEEQTSFEEYIALIPKDSRFKEIAMEESKHKVALYSIIHKECY